MRRTRNVLTLMRQSAPAFGTGEQEAAGDLDALGTAKGKGKNDPAMATICGPSPPRATIQARQYAMVVTGSVTPRTFVRRPIQALKEGREMTKEEARLGKELEEAGRRASARRNARQAKV